MSGRMPGSRNRKPGMALPIIVAIVFVLSALILAFYTYSSSRVRATGAVLNGFSALAAAEAGIHCVLMEMRNSQGWATHELEITPAGEFEWKEEVTRPVRLEGDSDVSIEKTPKGTYSGKLGGGSVFAMEFKVRAAKVPLKDDPATPAVDEANRYVRIESIGKKRDPTGKQDRYTKIVVFGEVSNFTEFVVYDGEKVILGMGSHNDAIHSNVFADGRIYGHQAVKLGNIEQSGTIQKFVNLDCLRSAGPIEIKDAYQVTFQKPPALAGKAIELGPSNDSDGPSEVQTASGNVLDGERGGALSIPKVDGEFYRKQAERGGLDISGLTGKKESIPLYPTEITQDAIELDFGKPGYDGSGTPPDDEKALGKPYPPGFNGLIYSSKPISIWGCPDRDVTLFSEGDIFISGDFNIHPNHRQNYQPKYQPKGLQAVDGTPFYQYRETPDEQEKWLDGSGDPIDPKQRERVAAALISMGRVWFDYRHPARFLANELKGLIKFEMLKALLGDETKAYDWVRYPDASPAPVIQPLPASAVKVANADGTDDLGPELQSYFGKGGTGSLSNLQVTTKAYDAIKQAFVAAVADGQLTREDLDGVPGKPGVLDAIVKGLQDDEEKVQQFWAPNPDPDFKDLTPPMLGSFTAPQRLYELVYDERNAGLTQHPPNGKYSDLEGTKKEMMEDELYMPQMSMYAMIFVNAKRNDDPAENSTDDPQSMNRRFDDLGNGRGKKVHFLTTMQGLEELKAGNLNNIMTPLIQRFVGSEIRLARVANHPPALKTGNYWPPIRRRIYDHTLAAHPPPMIPQVVEIKSWQQLGATKKDFDGF